MFTHQELASYLYKNVFSDKRKTIRLNNLVPYPRNRPNCKYRVNLSCKSGKAMLYQVKLKLLEMDNPSYFGSAGELSDFVVNHLESLLNEVKAGNYTYV